MHEKYLLGIDQGSTGSKAIVVNSSGEVVASAYRQIGSTFPQDGWLEHDPEDIWESVRGCLVQLAHETDLSGVCAVGITNQRETTMLWERATGKPLTPAISWQCTRSQGIIDRWAPFSGEILETTGLISNTYYSASKLAWLFENTPGLRERCERGEVCFGNVNTWIIWRLTGGHRHVTDSSNAGRTMVFDIRKNELSNSLLAKMDIPECIFPEVLPCDGDFGLACNPAEAFPTPVPIRASIGDQMSALFGQLCFEPGEAKCTVGTSLNLVTYTGRCVPPTKGILPAIASNLSGKLSYEVEGGVNVAGSIYEWLSGQLGIASGHDEINALAAQVQSDGAYFVPAFGGLFAPHWNSGARALIIGLSKFHDKRHICRAAVESIALQANDVVETLRGDLGIDVKTLKVDGGVARSDFAMQIFADITGCRVERPVNTDSTPMGAVYVAGLAVGVWKSKEELRSLWKLDRAFEPGMDPEARKRLLSGWSEAVRRSLDWQSSI